MGRSRDEVRQEVFWELEARDEYSKQNRKRWLRRLIDWCKDHILGTTIGLVIGAVFGLGWGKILDYTNNQNERSAILLEFVGRLANIEEFIGRLDAAQNQEEVRRIVADYRPYVVNPLRPSPFAASTALKDEPDYVLGLRYRKAQGSREVYEKMTEVFSEAGKVFRSYLALADSAATPNVRTMELTKQNGEALGLIDEGIVRCVEDPDWPFEEQEINEWVSGQKR